MIVIRQDKRKIGQCYQRAFELLEEYGDGYRLIHGYPRLTAGRFEGRKFGYAWIEHHDREFVIDSRGLMCLAAMYYSVGQIDSRESQIFTLQEARRLALQTETYGPWGQVPADAMFAEDAPPKKRKAKCQANRQLKQ